MNATLTSLLDADAVPFDTLHARYGPVLELVRKLIGVVPNCDPYLEIWPTGFRTYNVMVPNFLNLPFSIWGLGAPADVIGVAMYVASRTAGCAYCSAHCCSFALRRGAAPEAVAHALDEDGSRPPAERAVVAVARALSRIPCEVDEPQRQELRRHFSAAHVEWIVLSVCMMGFLNKFMDALGVELEGSTVDEVGGVIGPSGWTPGKHLDRAPSADGRPPPADTFATKLGVVPKIPAALSFDRGWTAGAPDRWPAAGEHLRERTGHDFPVLGRLTHGRPIRAITAMLRDNLDPATSVVGLPTKCLAGVVYASVVGDAALAADVRALAAHNRIAPALLDEAVRFASAEGDLPSLDASARAALRLIRAASPSPAIVDGDVIEGCRALPPPAIIELLVWVSVLQMLHRLGGFFPPGASA